MKLDSEQLAIIRLHVLHPHAVLPEVLAYDISLLIAELDSREQSRALQLSADSLRDVAGPISPHVSTRCVEPAPPIPPPEYERLGNQIIELESTISRLRRDIARSVEEDNRMTRVINEQNLALKEAALALQVAHGSLSEKAAPHIPEDPSEVETYRGRAITFLILELDRQDAKWGPLRKHHPLFWNSVAMEELGEAAEATLLEENQIPRKPGHEWENEMIHLAAVAVQAVMARFQSQDSAKALFHPNDHGSVDVP